MRYTINFARADESTGAVSIKADNDAEAVRHLRAMLEDGYMHMTWASMDVCHGVYRARLVDGKVIGGYVYLRDEALPFVGFGSPAVDTAAR